MTNQLLPALLAVSVVGASQPATPPLACRANALDQTQRKRQQELLGLMRKEAQERRDLPDGYAFRLSADPTLFQQAAEWISLERLCCPFLEFSLEWKQDETVWVRLTGGPGAKEFIALEMVGM